MYHKTHSIFSTLSFSENDIYIYRLDIMVPNRYYQLVYINICLEEKTKFKINFYAQKKNIHTNKIEIFRTSNLKIHFRIQDLKF